jgi:hypothetical protein
MLRSLCCVLTFLTLCPAARARGGPEVIDPEQAQADWDFAIQGEYLGKGSLPGGDDSQIGAQVIAQGEGQFRVVIYRGGLPGAGWQRGDDQFVLQGSREAEDVPLAGDRLSGGIAGRELTLLDSEGNTIAQLQPTQRKSPTLGEKPPADALVLFDGENADQFNDGQLTEMKTLEAGTTLREDVPMKKLHLEFRLSWKPQARGQGRSNSGVYIGGIPEIQVLDSFGLEGRSNECGGLYGRREPDVNMCFPPLVWQTFDVEFAQPPRNEEGQPQGKILVTVRHNGVVIHEDYDTRHAEHGPRRLHFQRHGNRVQYRNIWVVPPE